MSLLPCPFCGVTDTYLAKRLVRGDLGVFVTCGACAAEGPMSVTSSADAEAMWNTRAEGEGEAEVSGTLVGMYFSVHLIFPPGVPQSSEAGWGRVARLLPGGDVLLEYRDVENVGPTLLPYSAVLMMEQAAPYHFFETEEEAKRLFEQARALMRAMAPTPGTPPPGAGLPS